MSDLTSNGISITTHTETCCEFPVTSNIMYLFTGDQQTDECMDCYENKESKQDNIGWDLHEDDRLGEGKGLSVSTDEAPNASDWVSSETVVKPKGKRAVFTEKWQDESMHLLELTVKFIDQDDPWLLRKEYLPPIAQLMDGGTHDELWELDDMTQRARETECQWCHLMTPKAFNDCQDCDKPLESNVR